MKTIDYLSTLFVGIDIGSRTNVVSAIDFNQHFLIKKQSFANTQEGVTLLEQHIVSVLSEHHHFKFVLVALESTGLYGVHLANYLSSSDYLFPFSVQVYCINPKEIANYKKSFIGLQKNDAIDSFVIADFARVGRIQIKPWRGSQYLALQRLTRHRLHIANCIATEKTYMLNNIFLKFSEFALLSNEDHPFSNKYSATSKAILTDFLTNEDLINMDIEKLVDFINVKSKRHIADPEKTAKLLKTAIRNSYKLDKCLYEPLTISIASSFNCISSFERELKTIDKAILKTVNGLNPNAYKILLSIPGIGKVFAAGILAEIGSIDAFKNNNALAKYAGIFWSENQSGNFKAEDTKMMKTGNKYLRYYIIEATNSAIRHCPELKNYYDKKYLETPNHKHKRSLALTSRKFIRILFGLLDKECLYSSKKSG